MSSPVLSIVLPTYNAESQLERFFCSLENQDFPKKNLEVLMIDGGSTDGSLKIAKKHHIRVIHNPKKLAEPGVALGCQKARGELVMVLATDNIYKDIHAIKTMVSVFQDKDIAGAFPKHDTGPDDSLYSRYFNTFTDPFTHFIYGKAANARTFMDVYHTVKHTKIYDIYDFSSFPVMPVIALAQGFTLRRSYLSKRKEIHDDILTIYKLIRQKKHIVYVYSVSLYHYTADTFRVFANKQSRGVENALIRNNSGISKRGSYLTGWQKVKQYLYIPYGISIVFPVLIAVYNYVITGERMWLLHPYMVFLSAIIIAVSMCRVVLGREK